MFPVTFADGEWVKEIRVSAPEDGEAEPMKFGAFTLIDHLGAEIHSGAATLILSVADNEAPEPFTIGFAQAAYEADKAAGTARVVLRREGGSQTAVSVDYATADGTALAGRDYQSVTGTAFFYAGVDEAVIQVPLIDDGAVSREPRVFRLTLSGLKGDGDHLCTLTRTETQVALTNSGTGGAANLATMLFDGQAEDMSGSVTVADTVAAPVSGRVITGEQVTIPEDEILYAQIEGLDAPEALDGDTAGLMTYDYGRISFPSTWPSSYWGSTAWVAGSSPNDITGWSGGSAYGNGWQVESDNSATVTLTVPHMAQMYTGFNGSYQFSSRLSSFWHDEWGWAYGEASVSGDPVPQSVGPVTIYVPHVLARTDADPYFWRSGLLNLVANLKSNRPSASLSAAWGVEENVRYVNIGIGRHYCEADSKAYSRITRGTLTRRTLDGGMNLRIHTANDGGGGSGGVRTAPDGVGALDAASGVYSSMMPKVSVVPGAGGVSYGRLYVGSKLQIELQNLDSYKTMTRDDLNAAVYLTRSDGSVVQGPEIELSGSLCYITMVWDGMTAAGGSRAATTPAPATLPWPRARRTGS